MDKMLNIFLVAVEVLALAGANRGIVSFTSPVVGRKFFAAICLQLLLGDHDRLAMNSENNCPNEVNDHVQQRKDGVGLVTRSCVYELVRLIQ